MNLLTFMRSKWRLKILTARSFERHFLTLRRQLNLIRCYLQSPLAQFTAVVSFTRAYTHTYRRSSYNGYCCKKVTRWYRFKSWPRLCAFHKVLKRSEKVWIQLPPHLQLWVNSRADCYDYRSRRRKILNSNLKYIYVFTNLWTSRMWQNNFGTEF